MTDIFAAIQVFSELDLKHNKHNLNSPQRSRYKLTTMD